jgi:hypothetical protein
MCDICCHLFNHYFAATGKCEQKALEPMLADLDPAVREHHCWSALLVQAISSTTAPTYIAELALKMKKISSESGQGSVVEGSANCTAKHVCSVHLKTEILSDIQGSQERWLWRLLSYGMWCCTTCSSFTHFIGICHPHIWCRRYLTNCVMSHPRNNDHNSLKLV